MKDMEIEPTCMHRMFWFCKMQQEKILKNYKVWIHKRLMRQLEKEYPDAGKIDEDCRFFPRRLVSFCDGIKDIGMEVGLHMCMD